MSLTCRTEGIDEFDVLYLQKALVSLTCRTEGIGEFDMSYRRHWRV